MSWTSTQGPHGPEWSGFDSLYNPRHRYRWPACIVGGTLIVIHYVLVSIFESFLFTYLNAESVDELTLGSIKFVFLPGAAALVFGGWFCRKYLNRSWKPSTASWSIPARLIG